MRSNKATMGRFYSGLAHLDADAMGACYAPQAQFDDEIFSLQGRDDVVGMWRMLCQSQPASDRADWKLDYRTIDVNEQIGCAFWSARYRFGPTRRLVQNQTRATFLFGSDGQIVQHHDQFDFWHWSRQALGMTGLLLGWTPLLRRQVRAKARAGLTDYLADHAARRQPITNN